MSFFLKLIGLVGEEMGLFGENKELIFGTD